MKPFLHTLLLLLTSCALVAGQTTVPKAEQLFKAGELIMGKEAIETLPILYQRQHLPFVKVNIEGKDYLFLFDTGASTCVLSKEIAGNENKENNLQVADDIGNKIKTNSVFKNIQIGSSTFKNMACIVADTKRITEMGCVQIDGIIGANLMQFCNWEINPIHQTLSFSKIAFKKQDTIEEFKVELTNSFLPLIKFEYDGIPFYTLIDSGFSDYFEMNEDLLKKSKKFRKLKSIKGIGQHSLTLGGTANGKIRTFILDSLKTTNACLVNIPSMSNDSKPKLGAASLSRYIFTYNFLENTIHLHPILKENSMPQAFGVNLGLNDSNELIIHFICLDEETQKLGLKLGEQVLQIDQQYFNKLSALELCDLKAQLETKNKIQLVVKKGNKTQAFELTKTARFPSN